jgi:hypothetical protein
MKATLTLIAAALLGGTALPGRAQVQLQVGPPPVGNTAPQVPTNPSTPVAVGQAGMIVGQQVMVVLGFNEAGTQALVEARETAAGKVFARRYLLIDETGVLEELPISHRPLPLTISNRDHIEKDICIQNAMRLQELARDIRMVTVQVGLCGTPSRMVARSRDNLSAVPLSAKLNELHAKVGFTGLTYLPRRGPLALVVGTDVFGNDRLGVTTREDAW